MTATNNINMLSNQLFNFILNELDYIAPYDNKQCSYTRSEWLNKKGIYVIRCKDTKQVFYVGRTGHCLYQQSYRHFTKHRKANIVKGRYKDTWFNRETTELALFEYNNDPEILEVMLTDYFKPKYNRNLFTKSRANPQIHCLRNRKEEGYTADYDLIEWFDSQNEVALIYKVA